MSTAFKIIGAYKIIPTNESIVQAIKFLKYDWLLDDKGKFTDAIYWENFENLSLIEMQVSGDFHSSLLMEISQNDINNGEQAPYLEFYLNSSGKNFLSQQEAISMDDRRLCFFLHFTNPNLPLKVGKNLIKLPAISALPERLVEFTNYVPPD